LETFVFPDHRGEGWLKATARLALSSAPDLAGRDGRFWPQASLGYEKKFDPGNFLSCSSILSREFFMLLAIYWLHRGKKDIESYILEPSR